MTSAPAIDTRIAYGATCTWWDAIQKVGKHESGLPGCPHCKGLLLEMEDEAEWFKAVDEYEAAGHPGYHAFVEWTRGRCFPTHRAARAAYEALPSETR